MEMVKASPFAVMCIIFVIILSKVQKKQIEHLTELYNGYREDLNLLYSKTYKKLEKREKDNQNDTKPRTEEKDTATK